jgi:beta-N-acetylhexosaminidase
MQRDHRQFPFAGAATVPHTLAWTRRQVLSAGTVAMLGLLAGCRPVTREAAGPRPIAQDPELRRKLAQMVLVGFRGTTLDPANPIVADIRDRGLGGVVLFDYDLVLHSPVRNVESPAQVAALDASLAALATTPLMLATDEEGGKVARLDDDNGFPPTLQAQEVGARNDPAFTYDAAAAMAKTLKAAGINHNFAPVVDLNVNPDSPAIGHYGRSYSADPAVVVAQAAAFIQAHHDNGITTTLKHFPGHGSSRTDSHKGFVDVTNTWQPIELEPYRQLIAQGLVDAVMTAHVFNAQLDPDAVATLSKPIITGILREQLGFDGVVFSDDMQMGAIADNYGFEDAVVRTVEAGVDIVAIANELQYDPDIAAKTIDILAAAVADGRISPARIDESYRRIMALKTRWGAQE